MDYATAIREGCKVLPHQARFCYDADLKGACVNFTALTGLVGLTMAIQIGTKDNGRGGHTDNMNAYLEANLPEATRRTPLPCKCPQGEPGPLSLIAMHLNDHHKKWTREKIADWIENLA